MRNNLKFKKINKDKKKTLKKQYRQNLLKLQ